MEVLEYKSFLTNSSSDEIAQYITTNLLVRTSYLESEFPDDWQALVNHIIKSFPQDDLEIKVSGSALCGYSFHKFTPFSLGSDIDLSLVSPTLYSEYEEHLRLFQMKIRARTAYLDEQGRQNYFTFLKYHAIGWFRPDKIPRASHMNVLRRQIREILNAQPGSAFAFQGQPIRIGIFKSDRHLTAYLTESLLKTKHILETT